MTWTEAIHSLAMEAVSRMSGMEIVLSLLILVSGGVALFLMPSPIHNRIVGILKSRRAGKEIK